MIKAYDHAHAVLEETMTTCGIPVEPELTAIKDASIGVGHTGDELAWSNMVSASPAESVRIRTSSAGRTGYVHKHDRGVLVLELQISHDPGRQGVTAAEWQLIFRRLTEQNVATGIVGGDIPADLRRFFGTGAVDRLVALSILCQGYLAAQQPAECGVDIKVQAQLKASGAADQVMSKLWWLDVFATTEALRTAIDREWSGSQEARRDVDALVKGISDATLTWEIVRDAEIAIRKSLELTARTGVGGNK